MNREFSRTEREVRTGAWQELTRRLGFGSKPKALAPPPASQPTNLVQPDRTSSTEQTATALCIDISKSQLQLTSEKDPRPKIDHSINSACSFIMACPKSAEISIIAYNHNTHVLVPLTRVEENKLDMIQAIKSLKPEGGTIMFPALKSGEAELAKAVSRIKRLLSQTDGLDNYPKETEKEAQRIKDKGIQITTIGFGSGHQIDEEFLRRIASRSQDGKPLYNHFNEGRALTMFMTSFSKTLTM